MSTRGTVTRHALVLAAGALLVLLLHAGESGRAPWNRAVGWASLLLLAVTLLVGPAARLVPRARGALRFRRELGVGSALFAFAHVALVLEEWAGWRLGPLYRRVGDEGRFVVDGGLALANLLGALALAYALVLAGTSSDAALRALGARWRAIQRGASTLFLLAVLHTVFFLYLDRTGGLLSGFGGAWPHGVLRWALPAIVLLVVAARSWALLRGPAPRP